ncbi:MAG: hypothetical protein D3910_27940 [Candidatus Electrothrix sp. ATG2]|nr:hypothetical protein [Candidatus Electrothrix sp. ATG2]
MGAGDRGNLGWLDIPACNPCADKAGQPTQAEPCTKQITITAAQPFRISLDSTAPDEEWHQSITLTAQTELYVRNFGSTVASLVNEKHLCDDLGVESEYIDLIDPGLIATIFVTQEALRLYQEFHMSNTRYQKGSFVFTDPPSRPRGLKVWRTERPTRPKPA